MELKTFDQFSKTCYCRRRVSPSPHLSDWSLLGNKGVVNPFSLRFLANMLFSKFPETQSFRAIAIAPVRVAYYKDTAPRADFNGLLVPVSSAGRNNALENVFIDTFRLPMSVGYSNRYCTYCDRETLFLDYRYHFCTVCMRSAYKEQPIDLRVCRVNVTLIHCHTCDAISLAFVLGKKIFCLYCISFVEYGDFYVLSSEEITKFLFHIPMYKQIILNDRPTSKHRVILDRMKHIDEMEPLRACSNYGDDWDVPFEKPNKHGRGKRLPFKKKRNYNNSSELLAQLELLIEGKWQPRYSHTYILDHIAAGIPSDKIKMFVVAFTTCNFDPREIFYSSLFYQIFNKTGRVATWSLINSGPHVLRYMALKVKSQVVIIKLRVPNHPLFNRFYLTTEGALNFGMLLKNKSTVNRQKVVSIPQGRRFCQESPAMWYACDRTEFTEEDEEYFNNAHELEKANVVDYSKEFHSSFSPTFLRDDDEVTLENIAEGNIARENFFRDGRAMAGPSEPVSMFPMMEKSDNEIFRQFIKSEKEEEVIEDDDLPFFKESECLSESTSSTDVDPLKELAPEKKSFFSKLVDPVRSVAQDLKDQYDKIGRTSGKIENLVDYIQTKFASIPSFSDLFKGLIDSIKDHFKTVGDYVKVGLAVVSLALLILAGLMSDPMIILYGLGGILGLSGAAYGFYAMSGEDNVSGPFLEILFEGFVSIFTNFIVIPFEVIRSYYHDFVAFWKNLKFKDIKDSIHTIGALSRDLNQAVVSIKHIRAAWDWFTEKVHIWWYGFPKGLSDTELVKLIALSMKMLSHPDDNRANMGIYPFIIKHLERYQKNFVKSARQDLLTFTDNLLTKLRNAATESAMKNFRARRGNMPPFCIFVQGESGKGKSSAVTHLAEAFAHYITGQESVNNVYYRTNDPNNDFYDGYQHQPVLVCDDFGQLVSMAGVRDDYLELIKWKNIAAYQLNMAALEDKKNTYFTTPIVILTSNVFYPFTNSQIKSIICPDAINNRIDVVVECYDRGKYRILKSPLKPFSNSAVQECTNDNLFSALHPLFDLYFTHQFKVHQAISFQFNKQSKVAHSTRSLYDAETLFHFLRMQDSYQAPIDENIAAKLMAFGKAVMNDGVITLETDDLGFEYPVVTEDKLAKLDDDVRRFLSQGNGAVKIRKALITLLEGEDCLRLSSYKRHKNWKMLTTDSKIRLAMDEFYSNFHKDKFFIENIDILKMPPNFAVRVLDKFKVCSQKVTHSCVCTNKYSTKDHCGNEDYAALGLDTLAFFAENVHRKDIDYFTTCPFAWAEQHFVTLGEFSDYLVTTNVPENVRAIFYTVLTESSLGKNGWIFNLPIGADKNAIRFFASFIKYPNDNGPNSWEFVKEYLFKDNRQFPIIFSAISATLGVMATTAAIVTGIRLYQDQRREIVEPMSSNPQVNAKLHHVRVHNPVISKTPMRPMMGRAQEVREGIMKVRAQIQEDPLYAMVYRDKNDKPDTTVFDLIPIILNQICKVWVHETDTLLVTTFWVNTRTFWLTHHAILAHDLRGKHLRFEWPDKGANWDGMIIPFDECKVSRLQDAEQKRLEDMTFIQVPAKYQVPGMRDLRKKFLPLKDTLKLQNSDAVLLVIEKRVQNGKLVGYYPHIRSMQGVQVHYSEVKYEYKTHDQTTETTVLPKFMYVPYGGNFGDCGSVLLVVDSTLAHGARIAGAFVAGTIDKGYGACTMITQEQSDLALKNFEKEIVLEGLCNYTYRGTYQIDNAPVVDVPKFADLPYVGVQEEVYLATKNNIVPSAIQKLPDKPLPVCRAPAQLKPFMTEDGVLIDPLLKALTKFEHPVYPVDAKVLKWSVEDYKKTINVATRKYVPKLTLTLEQAIFGDTEDVYISGLDAQTSAGYYWSDKKRFPGTGKTGLINLDDKWVLPEFKEACLRLLEKARKGIGEDCVFVNHLKVEKRPIAKVKLGSTRLFSGSQAHLTVVMKMLFGSFISHLMHNRIDNEQAVGINPTSREWDYLARLLQTKGQHIIAGDFKNYDGSLNRYILHEIIDIINDWYGKDNPDNLAREVIFFMVISATYCCKGDFYILLGANPSGNALTAFINGIYGCLFFRYCYYLRMDQLLRAKILDVKHIKLFRDFSAQVKLVVFGDDNIMNVSDTIIGWFNPLWISEVAADIGMEYTSCDKTGINDTFITIKDATFLKRHFVYDPEWSVYFGPLELEVVLDTPNWTWIGITSHDLAMGVEQVVRELAVHPTPIYEKWVPIVLDAAKRCKYPLIKHLPQNLQRAVILYGDSEGIPSESL